MLACSPKEIQNEEIATHIFRTNTIICRKTDSVNFFFLYLRYQISYKRLNPSDDTHIIKPSSEPIKQSETKLTKTQRRINNSSPLKTSNNRTRPAKTRVSNFTRSKQKLGRKETIHIQK